LEAKPTLVVGATGKVGRLVVRELLAQGVSVHALVRNATKAAAVLPRPSALAAADAADAAESASPGTRDSGRLTLFVGDVNDEVSLRAAMQGCGAVVSVAGTFRLSQPGDFWPWRFFGNDCMEWCTDLRHPYFVNFVGTQRLVKLAEELQARSEEEWARSRTQERDVSSFFSPFVVIALLWWGCACVFSKLCSFFETCLVGRLLLIVFVLLKFIHFFLLGGGVLTPHM
jgi:NAD(P)-dependent dehydrogenase (short-subunit alcohol dehydrogenase family)